MSSTHENGATAAPAVSIKPGNIESILKEKRVFKPSAKFAKAARIGSIKKYAKMHRSSLKNPDKFWGKAAENELTWFRKWKQVCVWKPPFAEWFVGGKINASYNCLDRHLEGPMRNKAALIFEGEPGDVLTLTYQQLHREVCLMANVLKKHGVKSGDRVMIYLPMIPEAVIAMLACARIGAPHSVVFSGFSAEALKERTNDCGAKVIITADGGFRRGSQLAIKRNVDEALHGAPKVKSVLVVQRTKQEVTMTPGRDFWLHEEMQHVNAVCPAEVLDSEHPLFILYTSGSTGKPKGILHTTAGYLLGCHMTTKYYFDLSGPRTSTSAPPTSAGSPATVTSAYGVLSNGGTSLHLRRRAQLPRGGPLLADHRPAQGEHLLHRADRDPFVHQVGRRLADSARSLVAEAARHRRRADQSRGVDVVSRQGRRQTLPDRGYVVADRDRLPT